MLATSTYRENRARMARDELQAWEGRWVAFSPDGSRILCGAPDLTQLADALRNCGVDASDCVLERIEFDDGEALIGGAEGQ
jgi:hypothetical protein